LRTDEKLKTIYETASRMIVRGEAAWKDFLAFAARIHKYSFDNALLVYAQNPNVTALATLAQWNRVERNVHKGSKSIAVCEYENAKLTLTYLFDITSTYGKEVQMTDWQLDEATKTEIVARFNRADSLEATAFSETVTALASRSAEEHYERCLRTVKANAQNHLFAELPEGGLEAQLISLLTDSTAYLVGKRCGLTDDEIPLEGGMSTISDFNRIPLIAALGNAVMGNAKEILIEMEHTIKSIRAERKIENERERIETPIHGERRHPVSESASLQRRNGRPTAGQIRQNGAGISERQSPGPLYSFENGWQSDVGDARGTADRHRTDREADGRNAGGRSDPRHRGHDGENPTPQQREVGSRGDRDKRDRADSEIIIAENTFVRLPQEEATTEITAEEEIEPPYIPQNFRYSEDLQLYPNGAKSKYKANIEAIKLLKAIEADKRQATPEEQIILARYVGWGGLANAFSEKAKDWKNEYHELKTLLTEEEYTAAMNSTATACRSLQDAM